MRPVTNTKEVIAILVQIWYLLLCFEAAIARDAIIPDQNRSCISYSTRYQVRRSPANDQSCVRIADLIVPGRLEPMRLIATLVANAAGMNPILIANLDASRLESVKRLVPHIETANQFEWRSKNVT